MASGTSSATLGTLLNAVPRRIHFRSIIVLAAVSVGIGLAFPSVLAKYGFPLLGTLLGALATIFALLGSTAILLFQQLSSSSPNILRFFPTRSISFILLCLGGLLVADGILLVTPESSILRANEVVSIIVALHLPTVFFVLSFVSITRNWLLPRTIVQHIRVAAQTCKTYRQRIEVLEALGDLGITYVEKGYTNTIRPLILAYLDLIDSYVGHPEDGTREPDEDEAFWDAVDDRPDKLALSIYRLISSVSQLGIELSEHTWRPSSPTRRM